MLLGMLWVLASTVTPESLAPNDAVVHGSGIAAETQQGCRDCRHRRQLVAVFCDLLSQVKPRRERMEEGPGDTADV